jgi:hypothetical protein
MLRTIQLQLQANTYESMDLVVDSEGGNVGSVQAIISLLLDFQGEIRTWVPFRAHSGATLITLCMLSKGTVTASSLAFFSPVDPILNDCKDGAGCRHTLTGYRSQLDMLKQTPSVMESHDVAVAAELVVVAQDIRSVLQKYVLPLIKVPTQQSQLMSLLLTGAISHESQIITPKQLQALGLPIQIHNPTQFPQQIFNMIKS